MDKIIGGVEATVLRSHSLGRVIYMHVEIIKFPFIHSFLFFHPNIYVLVKRENKALLRARFMKPNKKATAKPSCTCLGVEDSLWLAYIMIMGAERRFF